MSYRTFLCEVLILLSWFSVADGKVRLFIITEIPIYCYLYKHTVCGPGVDSASNRNEYKEHFLGVNAAGA